MDSYIKDKDFEKGGCVIAGSIEGSPSVSSQIYGRRAMVMGGGLIYRQLLPYCDGCYVTKIDAAFKQICFQFGRRRRFQAYLGSQPS